MENVKDQVVEETTEITEETTHKQPESNNEPFRFNQDELDEVVAKRLARERESFAKKLGVDNYDGIDSFIENYQTTLSEKKELGDKYESVLQDAFNNELRINALMSGVKPEHLDRVVKLTTAELENLGDDDDIDIPSTLNVILDEFPMFKSSEPEAPVRRIGQQPSSETNSKTEIDRYLEKYKNSKYYNK